MSDRVQPSTTIGSGARWRAAFAHPGGHLSWGPRSAHQPVLLRRSLRTVAATGSMATVALELVRAASAVAASALAVAVAPAGARPDPSRRGGAPGPSARRPDHGVPTTTGEVPTQRSAPPGS